MANYILKLKNDGIDYTTNNNELLEYVEIGQNKKTILLDKEGTESIDLSLHKISFHRKVYEPGLIDATIQISVDTSKNMPKIQKLLDLFMRKIVQLDVKTTNQNNEEITINIASEYYVHEIRPRYKTNKTSMYVELKIFSLDNLMRINKFSEAYLGRKLREYIVTNGITDYGFKGKTFDGKEKDNPYKIKLSDNDVLQNLSYGGVEFIQPYLVQYNETFYDFLARVCNRCGEFMYFEDGELHIGLHFDEGTDTNGNKTKNKKLTNINEGKCNSIDYQNISEGVISVENYSHDSLKYEEFDNAGKLKNEPKNNNKSYNITQVNDTGAYPNTKQTEGENPTKIYNDEVSNNEFFMPLYRDEFSGGETEQYLKKNIGEYILLGKELASDSLDVLDLVNHLLVGVGQIEAKAAIKGDKARKDGNKTIDTWAGSDQKMGVPFADNERHRWTTLCYYSDIKCNEEIQEQKMVNVDMGDAFENLRLGDVVTLPYDDDNKYVIVEVENVVEKTGSGTNTTYISGMQFKAVPLKGDGKTSGWNETSDNKNIVYTDNGTFKFFPPLLKTGAFRQSEPQHAIVIDSDDPKNQGRVRVRFPWQSKVDENMLETDDPQVKKLVEKKKNLEKRRDSINDMSSANGNSSDDNKKKFKNNIKKVQKWKKECESEITELETKINELTGTIDSNNQKLNNLKDKKEKNVARNGEIDKEIENNNTEIENNNTEIENNNKAIKENDKEIENNNKAIKDNNKAIKENGDPNGEKGKGNENLNEENENLKEENKKLKEKNEKLEEKNKELKEDNEKKKKQKSDNNVVIAQYHKYESEKAECERMLSYYKTEKALYDDEKDVYGTFLKELLNDNEEKDYDGLIKQKSIDDNLEKQFKKNKKKALKSIKKVIDEIEEEIKKIVPKPMALLEAGTPWIRMVTPMATKGGGMYFKPEKGDEVMVDFENGNIERPFVVGALYSKNAVAPMLPANEFAPSEHRVIKSPNGHYIKFEDATNLTTMLSFLPILKFLKQWNIMIPWLDIGDSESMGNIYAKKIMGGITISDGFDMCQVYISGHDRKVTVKSTLGDVEISALSGITVSAPNGNIKIEGKNIDITAGNRLTLTSGTNIYKNPLSHGEIKSNDYWSRTTKAVGAETIAKHTEQLLGSVIDMSAIRGFLECIIKPVNGTMQIKSHSFMQLEAGEGKAEIPATAYKEEYLENTTINKGHKTSPYQQLEYDLRLIFSIPQRIKTLADLYNKACKKLAVVTIDSEGTDGAGAHAGELIFENITKLTADEFITKCQEKMNSKTLRGAVWRKKDFFWQNAAHPLSGTYQRKYGNKAVEAYMAVNELWEFLKETKEIFEKKIEKDDILNNKEITINDAADLASLTLGNAEFRNMYDENWNMNIFLNNPTHPNPAARSIDYDTNLKPDLIKAARMACVRYLFGSNLWISATAATAARSVAADSTATAAARDAAAATATAAANAIAYAADPDVAIDAAIAAASHVTTDDASWNYFVKSLGLTLSETNEFWKPLGNKLLKIFDEKALTYLPEWHVWSSDVKGRILISEGAETMCFTRPAVVPDEERTVEIKAIGTPRLDKNLTDGENKKAALQNIKCLLLEKELYNL